MKVLIHDDLTNDDANHRLLTNKKGCPISQDNPKIKRMPFNLDDYEPL
jgi:hypothetical protein